GVTRRRHPSSILIFAITAPVAIALRVSLSADGKPLSRARPRLDELVGAQVVIGLDDFAQFVFRRTIAPIGVRMMAFDQILVARLDLRRGGGAVELKRQQRLNRQGV